MRILQISSAKTYGGGERHVVDLCRGLQSRDHDVFAALRPTSQWQDRLNFLPPERLLRVSIRNSIGVFSAIKMAEFAREHDIDVIHAHVARDYIPASIACMAARDARFVLTRHVMFPLKPFNRFALKNLSMAIGVSEAVGGELRRIFPYDKVRVIPNGLDTQSVDAEDGARLRSEFRSSHSLPMDAPVVGTLGELKELKGQREFVLAAAEIVKKIPNCRFVVVGLDNTMDKRFRRDLKRLALVSGIENKILWLDWLEDTAPFYAAIDVFVSPSRSESFGLAILEAMGNGKPIVSTATDGAQQLLKDCGTLVGVNDAVGMADAIVGVLKNPDLLNASGRAAKKVAAQRYSLDRMIAATEKLYSELLSDRPASSLK